jgi:hypothetical protein
MEAGDSCTSYLDGSKPWNIHMYHYKTRVPSIQVRDEGQPLSATVFTSCCQTLIANYHNKKYVAISVFLSTGHRSFSIGILYKPAQINIQ